MPKLVSYFWIFDHAIFTVHLLTYLLIYLHTYLLIHSLTHVLSNTKDLIYALQDAKLPVAAV